ncbi:MULTISPECIES: hypothetical protein [Streptomyces]|nr:hypothetical protein [Streptomyces griseus]SEE87645.1 hypothetical protein SAMN04490359_6639 [Streptomyces griseus]SQA23598.1 Uncharacterised protein [Streptomyces griseus]
MDEIPSKERSSKALAYIYDAERLPVISALITDALEGVTSYHEIGSLIFGRMQQQNVVTEAEARETASIFYYRFDIERGPGSKPGALLEPLSEKGDEYFWPRPVRTADSDVLKLWDALLPARNEPEIQGLLADLLFSARHQKPHIYARAAVEGYLASREGDFSEGARSEMLVRSWSILRSMGMRDLEASVEEAMCDLVKKSLATDSPAPGTVIPILHCLLQGRLKRKGESSRSELPPEIVDYLFSALDHFKADYLSSQLAEMARECLKDTALVQRALKKAAANLLEAAEQVTDGHLKTHWLLAAAQFSRRFHLEKEHEECVRRLQAIDRATFNWTTLRAASTLRASDIESYLRTFDQPHLMDALVRFFDTPPPTGSREQNEKLARQILKNSLTAMIMGTATYGAHGMPQKSYNSDEDKLRYQVSSIETISMQAHGRFLSAALDRMAHTHKIPSTETLHAWIIECYGSDPGLCLTLAKSLSLFWEQEYISCVQLAMPRVEAAIRSLLLLLNEPIYRVEEDKSIGGFPGLGAMMPHIERHGLDPDWCSFINALLLTPGRNLRNIGAHGFLQDVDKQTAALVIRALSVVALLAPDETSKQASKVQAISESLAYPTGRKRLSLVDRLMLKAYARLGAVLAARRGIS